MIITDRDYTSRVVEGTSGSIVRFQLDNSGTRKLALVKLIKDVTGMGLKESKDFVDACDTGPVAFSKRMTKEQSTKFRDRLNEDCENVIFELNDAQANRNRKLISLGLSEKDEVIEELANDLTYRILRFPTDKLYINSLFTELLSHFDEDTLTKIFNTQNACK